MTDRDPAAELLAEAIERSETARGLSPHIVPGGIAQVYMDSAAAILANLDRHALAVALDPEPRRLLRYLWDEAGIGDGESAKVCDLFGADDPLTQDIARILSEPVP